MGGGALMLLVFGDGQAHIDAAVGRVHGGCWALRRFGGWFGGEIDRWSTWLILLLE